MIGTVIVIAMLLITIIFVGINYTTIDELKKRKKWLEEELNCKYSELRESHNLLMTEVGKELLPVYKTWSGEIVTGGGELKKRVSKLEDKGIKTYRVQSLGRFINIEAEKVENDSEKAAFYRNGKCIAIFYNYEYFEQIT